MKKTAFGLVIMFLMLIAACTQNPITGKSPFFLVNHYNENLMPMAFQQYQQVLKTQKLSTNKKQTAMVKTVGKNIQGAVERYLKAQNKLDFLNGYQWEYNLIEDNQLNAWCMPGGKVAFYTGIMPVCQNDNGVAVVMGHEITHALAQHSAQRATQALIAQGLQVAGNMAINDNRYRNVFNSLYPVGAQVGILAYSRQAELEADRIGLTLMAMAGYDPREAPKFWERMEAQTRNGRRPPEFLSTHPNPGRRIEQLKAELPKALQLYNQATGKQVSLN
ncbi:M48 family metallopeptidase [Ornithobacterium rhinotracheale]|uniref:M48 family metallopeptidase n=1 Tax=Ornithobacterium rhinotracheale TaxID=28251 RepID=UPI001FF53526|nr:M48 family metallopeptidase [Ornithobacterium rhinotracheale]MCK0204603.1 M48 family metallopeptidase [Ornithobacterium rhinotracheale]